MNRDVEDIWFEAIVTMLYDVSDVESSINYKPYLAKRIAIAGFAADKVVEQYLKRFGDAKATDETTRKARKKAFKDGRRNDDGPPEKRKST